MQAAHTMPNSARRGGGGGGVLRVLSIEAIVCCRNLSFGLSAAWGDVRVHSVHVVAAQPPVLRPRARRAVLEGSAHKSVAHEMKSAPRSCIWDADLHHTAWLIEIHVAERTPLLGNQRGMDATTTGLEDSAPTVSDTVAWARNLP